MYIYTDFVLSVYSPIHMTRPHDDQIQREAAKRLGNFANAGTNVGIVWSLPTTSNQFHENNKHHGRHHKQPSSHPLKHHEPAEPPVDLPVELPTRKIIDWLSMWRWASLAAHIVLLVVCIGLWTFNLSSRGRWKNLDRRWSVTNLQYQACHKSPPYSRPISMVLSASPNQPTVVIGDMNSLGGGVVWRRNNLVNLLGCANGTSGVVYDFSTWGIPTRLATNAAPSSSRGAFLEDIDISTLSILVLWVSTSHSIFTLPNTNHRQLLMEQTPGILGIAWRHNWVSLVLMAWNLTGLVVVYVCLGVRWITDATALVCAWSIVWSAGIHFLWLWLSKRTGCLLPEQIDKVLVGIQNDKRPSSVVAQRSQSLEHWTQFMRANEVSFSAPMLWVCWMGSMKDQHDIYIVQYVFGLVAAGMSLLLPLDALGMASQEEFAFGTLLCSEQPMGDLREAGARECARSVVQMSRVASVRVAAAGAIMLGWGATMYLSSVWEHTRTNTCLVAAAVYPLLVFVLGVARNLCRTILPGAQDEDDAKNGNVRGGGGAMLRFITTQAYLDNAYVVAWDVIGIFFKGWLVIGLSTRGYDTWV